MRIAALCLIALTAGARAQSSPPSPPCKRCTLEVPASHDGELPLLVVLHGDREHATAAASRWRGAAKQRGWALLSL
ncbi:MAG TPA: hypothetical protein VF469_07340, partial [Kofleriaceae bacterium]